MPESNAAAQQQAQSQPNTDKRDHTRYAIKTALSLTLAYLLPMALGWPQPQTAATTVMLIAATGSVSESLQKGVFRLVGTLAGAIIGLSLIALFPQDRMLYLLIVSMVVAFIIYLYGAYQGDPTVFMLTSVVTLMVFNGGDAEGAFIYGVDRAFMTAFGVLVYTLIASLLWPVRMADNTRELAASAIKTLGQTFRQLDAGPAKRNPDNTLDAAELLAAQEAFQAHLGSVRHDAEGVKAYLAEWEAIAHYLQRLTADLLPPGQSRITDTPEYRRFIGNYDTVLDDLQQGFQQAASAIQGRKPAKTLTAPELAYNYEAISGQSHRNRALIASRGQLLENLQESLQQLITAVNSIAFDKGGFSPRDLPNSRPTFLWWDREAVKTSVRAFVTFWVAATIWILYNPPGGFMFVTLCTILIPLVSYTPVTPKLLFILLSIGFLFAIPAYVFLLPNLTHWIELGLFLFSYAFVGFFVFKGPISIFFLLGLFTLGIQNTMHYNFAVIMSIVLMFYIVCALLIISVNFPFTSNRAQLYAGLPRRFFRNCQQLVQRVDEQTYLGRQLVTTRLHLGDALTGKLQAWGAAIDPGTYDRNQQEAISAFTDSCEVLQGNLRVAAARNRRAGNNSLIKQAHRGGDKSLQWGLCEALASGSGERIEQAFALARSQVEAVDQRLDLFLRAKDMEQYSQKELADFYVFLSMRVAIYTSLVACQEAYNALDWAQLKQHHFA